MLQLPKRWPRQSDPRPKTRCILPRKIQGLKCIGPRPRPKCFRFCLRQDQHETLLCLEIISRLRCKDQDHIPKYYTHWSIIAAVLLSHLNNRCTCIHKQKSIKYFLRNKVQRKTLFSLTLSLTQAYTARPQIQGCCIS